MHLLHKVILILFLLPIFSLHEALANTVLSAPQAFVLPGNVEDLSAVSHNAGNTVWASIEVQINHGEIGHYLIKRQQLFGNFPPAEQHTLKLSKENGLVVGWYVSNDGDSAVLCLRRANRGGRNSHNCFVYRFADNTVVPLLSDIWAVRVAFSYDGNQVAVAMLTQRNRYPKDTQTVHVQVFDLHTSKPLTPLLEHGEERNEDVYDGTGNPYVIFGGAEMRVFAFSADDRYLMTGGNAFIKQWQLPDGALVRHYPTGREDDSSSGADLLSADGKLLFAISKPPNPASGFRCMRLDIARQTSTPFDCKGMGRFEDGGLLPPDGSLWLDGSVQQLHSMQDFHPVALPAWLDALHQKGGKDWFLQGFDSKGQWLAISDCIGPLEKGCRWQVRDWRTGEELVFAIPPSLLNTLETRYPPRFATLMFQDTQNKTSHPPILMQVSGNKQTLLYLWH